VNIDKLPSTHMDSVEEVLLTFPVVSDFENLKSLPLSEDEQAIYVEQKSGDLVIHEQSRENMNDPKNRTHKS
jgi:hypothetical protein